MTNPKKMRARKIVWKSNRYSESGYAGRLDIFTVCYDVIYPKDKEMPIKLYCKLFNLKQDRFTSYEEAKQKAQSILEEIVKEITEAK